jgi:dienelactone hydrolase
MLLHGCRGVTAAVHDWAAWFQARGYVAMIVDSWAARGIADDCVLSGPELAPGQRFDDLLGALRALQARSDVDPARVGVIGWSNGGAFALSAVNGPSLERARRRGIVLPEPGIRAAVAMYPGGCSSLIGELAVRPLLVLIGDADDWTLPGPCREMAAAMRQRGADVTIVVYPGAVHYFDVAGLERVFLPELVNPNRPGGGATVGHDAGADADARRRIERFFGYHLRAEPR